MTHLRLAWLGGALALAFTVAPALAQDDSIVISHWPSSPAEGGPIEFQKPANIVHEEFYHLSVQTEPPTARVNEPFYIRTQILDPATGSPLLPVPVVGAPLHVILTDNKGNFAQHLLPVESTPGLYDAGLVLPWSGGHNIFVFFELPETGLVEHRFPLWVEGVAVRGADVTSNPSGGNLDPEDVLEGQTGQPGTVMVNGHTATLDEADGRYGRNAEISAALDDGTLASEVWAISKDGIPLDPHAATPESEANAFRTSRAERQAVIGEGGGGEGSFRFSFPADGDYWLWALFMADGEIVVAPYAITVS